MFFRLLSSVVLVFVVVNGFQLGDHRHITDQALEELGRCRPEATPAQYSLRLVAENLEEDVNLWNKWVLGYSHFFNPDRAVKVCALGGVWCRYTADVRVQELQDSIAEQLGNGDNIDWSGIMTSLGNAIHYLQDMCSPPHVVPVMHGMGDGFESFSTTVPESSSCEPDDFDASQSLIDIFKATATTTLSLLDQSLTVFSASAPDVTLSRAFWDASSPDDNGFGVYGSQGNTFGSGSLPNELYVSFKQSRQRAAVDATKKAFLWLWSASGSRDLSKV
eukprot:gnl/Spiro4/13447_TR7175_c0_g1_i1.p1 gnl/Spiro4/13447_TR7175_c0_g1~~gnl/Spiro4/13447_TR7175_c0_g1_i1.p1  ORF type:complete len:276 (-),score=44.88 gnl/Spiro4/13447_TR7175_c0_g1_i1:55-882(-)